MFIYIIIIAIVAVIAGLVPVLCTKKADDVIYGKLDDAGRITNLVLIPVYAVLSLYCIGIGIFCYPGYDEGFLRILGWLAALFIPSAPLFCFVGLGMSVALRRKGRRKQSFYIQFVGLISVGMSILMFFLFYGNLLSSLN